MYKANKVIFDFLYTKFLNSHCLVTQSRLTLCDPNGLHHSRLPCLSLSPTVCSNSCPLSQRCHSTISSSVIPFSCAQSFPASGSFPMSQLLTSGGQSIVSSISTSAFPINIQGWFPIQWTGWVSLQSKGLFESSPALQFKSINSTVLSRPYGLTLTSVHDYWRKHSFD